MAMSPRLLRPLAPRQAPAPPFQPIPIMTSATTPSGEASASAILAEGLEAWNAFDKESVDGDTTFYASAFGVVGEWIQYDFGFTVTAGGYQIHSRAASPYGLDQAPPAWTLSGSVDGATFTAIDTRTGVTDWNYGGELKTFTLSGPASYRYWRWTWDAVPYEPAVGLPKIQLVE